MKQTGVQVVATNRQARYRYFLSDTYEAGIVLTGSEVKSLRDGQVQLNEAWAAIDAGEAWLFGMHIAPYTHAQTHTGHDPTRKRKLLLHKHQIERIGMKLQVERLSLVPTQALLQGRQDQGRARRRQGQERRRQTPGHRQAGLRP